MKGRRPKKPKPRRTPRKRLTLAQHLIRYGKPPPPGHRLRGAWVRAIKREKREKANERRRKSRAAYKALRPKLERMKRQVEMGQGFKPWLAGKREHADYYEEKIRQKQRLGKKRMIAILETLQEDMMFDDIGWNIAYI